VPAALQQVSTNPLHAVHAMHRAAHGVGIRRLEPFASLDMNDAQLCRHRLEAAEGRADKAAAEAATQAAQLRDLFVRYKAFKSSEVADLAARLRMAMSGGSGGVDGNSAAGGKENDKAAAALLRFTAHHEPLWRHTHWPVSGVHCQLGGEPDQKLPAVECSHAVVLLRLGPQAIKRRRLRPKEERNAPVAGVIPHHLETIGAHATCLQLACTSSDGAASV
jgi:hypothetical protein